MNWLARISIMFVLLLTGCDKPFQQDAFIIAHPDQMGSNVEYYMSKPSGVGPWPTVILLHGYQPLFGRPGGRGFAKRGELKRLSNKGYLAVSISLPGHGGSTGPADFAGPLTQRAVSAVVAKLKAENSAIPDKVLIQGISLGAIAGSLVAANDPDLAGLVLISGLYDFPAFLIHPKSSAASELKSAFEDQTGGGDKKLRARSAMFLASKIKASALILNGAKDDRTDAEQAKLLAESINANGGDAQFHIYPDFGHEIPVKDRQSRIDSFVDSILQM